MATTKKQTALTEYAIDFLKQKNQELMEYIKSRPFPELRDRIEWKQTKAGGLMPMVIASIETQRKDLSQALIDFADIQQRIKVLEQDEEKLKQLDAKGQQGIPFSMRRRK